MTVGYKILVHFAVIVSLITYFWLYFSGYPASPKKSASESEKEKDAQIIELRSRVAKLKEENAVLEMEKEEERTIVESWVNGYNKLTKEKAALEAQLKAKEQALVDLQKDYAELKEERELLCATNSTLSKQVIEWEQKYSELKATYNTVIDDVLKLLHNLGYHDGKPDDWDKGFDAAIDVACDEIKKRKIDAGNNEVAQ